MNDVPTTWLARCGHFLCLLDMSHFYFVSSICLTMESSLFLSLLEMSGYDILVNSYVHHELVLVHLTSSLFNHSMTVI